MLKALADFVATYFQQHLHDSHSIYCICLLQWLFSHIL